MPFCNKYLRLTDKGIEISSVNASQSLRPDSQKSLFGYCAYALDVNECILKHGEKLDWVCWDLNSFRGISFYYGAGIINNVFDNILISIFKFKISELSEAGI